VNGDVRVQIMKEIEQQQVVKKRYIVVHEQYHEHIQQVQQQHQKEEIRRGLIKKQESYEHVNGDVRAQIMKEIEQL
jgi:hypothetical protein